MRLDAVGTRELAGAPRVHDGDTITLQGRRIRLSGIDAFEAGQLCSRDDGDYDCGAASTQALVDFIADAPLECRGRTLDRYGRLLAVCLAGSTHVNAAMVAAGWAVAYGDHDGEERAACKAGRGAWSGSFTRPAARRATHGGRVEARHDMTGGFMSVLRQLLFGQPQAEDTE